MALAAGRTASGWSRYAPPYRWVSSSGAAADLKETARGRRTILERCPGVRSTLRRNRGGSLARGRRPPPGQRPPPARFGSTAGWAAALGPRSRPPLGLPLHRPRRAELGIRGPACLAVGTDTISLNRCDPPASERSPGRPAPASFDLTPSPSSTSMKRSAATPQSLNASATARRRPDRQQAGIRTQQRRCLGILHVLLRIGGPGFGCRPGGDCPVAGDLCRRRLGRFRQPLLPGRRPQRQPPPRSRLAGLFNPLITASLRAGSMSISGRGVGQPCGLPSGSTCRLDHHQHHGHRDRNRRPGEVCERAGSAAGNRGSARAVQPGETPATERAAGNICRSARRARSRQDRDQMVSGQRLELWLRAEVVHELPRGGAGRTSQRSLLFRRQLAVIDRREQLILRRVHISQVSLTRFKTGPEQDRKLRSQGQRCETIDKAISRWLMPIARLVLAPGWNPLQAEPAVRYAPPALQGGPRHQNPWRRVCSSPLVLLRQDFLHSSRSCNLAREAGCEQSPPADRGSPQSSRSSNHRSPQNQNVAVLSLSVAKAWRTCRPLCPFRLSKGPRLESRAPRHRLRDLVDRSHRAATAAIGRRHVEGDPVEPCVKRSAAKRSSLLNAWTNASWTTSGRLPAPNRVDHRVVQRSWRRTNSPNAAVGPPGSLDQSVVVAHGFSGLDAGKSEKVQDSDANLRTFTGPRVHHRGAVNNCQTLAMKTLTSLNAAAGRPPSEAENPARPRLSGNGPSGGFHLIKNTPSRRIFRPRGGRAAPFRNRISREQTAPPGRSAARPRRCLPGWCRPPG